MIRPLRHRHRFVMCALSVLLPIGFLVGLTQRKAVPSMADLPPLVTGETSIPAQIVWWRGDLWPNHKISTQLQHVPGNRERFLVNLWPDKPVTRPDLLVYWSSATETVSSKLPENAHLIGAFVMSRNHQLPLPDSANGQTGVLILYSLADNELVDVSLPFQVEADQSTDSRAVVSPDAAASSPTNSRRD